MSVCINRKNVRRLALDLASKRAHKFNRVGEVFYVRADAALKAWVFRYIEQLPSKGKTIK